MPRARCLFETVKAAVQNVLPDRTCYRSPVENVEKHPQDSTEQKLAWHRNDTNPNLIHTLWQPANECKPRQVLEQKSHSNQSPHAD